MNRLFPCSIFSLGLFTFSLGLSLAQQTTTLNGVLQVDGEVAEATRVGIHLVDRDGAFQTEVASVTPVGGTFSLSSSDVTGTALQPFRSGSMLFPGLQNEYAVEPADVNYLRALVTPYVDVNANGVFDGPATDQSYIGVASLEEPIGFFSLVYVDKAATVTGKGAVLEFSPGWNIFTVRYPEEGDPSYQVEAVVEDVVLDVFLP